MILILTIIITITIIVTFDHYREAEEICNKCECDIRDYGKDTCMILLLMRKTLVMVMMKILMVMIMLMLMVMVMVIIQREEDLQDGMQL